VRNHFSRYVQPVGRLAHYTRAEVALEHILPSGALRMSPYLLMNDPVENKDLGGSTRRYSPRTDFEDLPGKWQAAIVMAESSPGT
jgi:hypothetical protein